MSRKLVIGLLVMLSVVVTSFTYAYWANIDYTVEQDANTVVIGEGRTVTVGVSVSQTGGQLVPNGQTANSINANPVEYVIFTFVVSLNDDKTGNQSGTLAATPNNILIGASATNNGLVVTAVQIGGTVTGGTLNADGSTTITEGTSVNVYVKVTLTAPATVEIYDVIKNANITFDVDFVVTPA